MRKWISFGIVALVAIGTGYMILNRNRLLSIVINLKLWQEFISVPTKETENIFEVTWDQENGVTRKEYCKAILRDRKNERYKLVAPWMTGIIIQKNIMKNTKIQKVKKDETTRLYSSKKSKE